MRLVFGAFRSRDAPDFTIRWIECKQIVIEELILVLLAIGDESDFFSIRRPLDGMLMMRATGQLPRVARCGIDEENVQPFIVVEMRVALRCGRLVEVACNDYRITA